jgi:two-component system, chemotaxis family, protein-glutamate methylesterase/glutaminase
MAVVILFCGSAGAIPVLVEVLPRLPGELVAPIVIALHLGPEPSRLPRVLGELTARRVREAEDKDPLVPATVLIAPPDYHLLVERDRTLALSIDPPVQYSRPSLDVLFESAADSLGADAIAVVLSGANDDGARGLRRIRDAGGIAIVQDPRTAAMPVMPLAAIATTGSDARVVRPDELPAVLLRAARGIR